MALLLTLTSVVSHAVRTRTSVHSSFVRGGVGASASAFSRTGGPIRMMALKAGIVGLPNVGKSTLFNALMGGPQAQAANFPFCTIEPNTGVIAVPDKRLDKLAEINKSVKKVPTSLSFVDIAGLVEGASKGEGLGNQFLANIRECDAIVHVVRCFDDANIIHVSGSVDPLRDIDVISLELILADLSQVEKRLEKARKDAKGKKEGAAEELAALEKILPLLNEGQPARKAQLDEEEQKRVSGLGLLSAKPVIYAANVQDSDLASGNEMVDRVRAQADKEGAKVVVVSAQVEAELAEHPACTCSPRRPTPLPHRWRPSLPSWTRTSERPFWRTWASRVARLVCRSSSCRCTSYSTCARTSPRARLRRRPGPSGTGGWRHRRLA